MFTRLKRGVALATAAGVLGVAGSAIATAPASAFTLKFGSATGSTVPAGTTWNAVNPTGTPAEFISPSSGGPLANCQSTTLSGVTTSTGGLTVTGPTAPNAAYSNCHLGGTTGGSTILVNPTFNWSVTPTSQQSTNVFNGNVSNVTVTVTCPPAQTGSPTEIYQGTLPGTETNQFSGGFGSKIQLTNSVQLTKTGGTCGVLPSPVNVSATYLLSKVNGATVTASTNLWETP